MLGFPPGTHHKEAPTPTFDPVPFPPPVFQPLIDTTSRGAGSSGPSESGGGGTSTKPTPAPRRPVSLRFTVSPSPTRKVNRTMAAAFAKSVPGFQRAPFLRAADAGWFTGAFRELARPMGWSDRDLGDVLAGNFVLSWMVVHGVDGLDAAQQAGANAFRCKLRARLKRLPAAGRLSNADKQRTAQMAATLAMIVIAQRIQYLKAGDQAKLGELTLTVSEGARKAFGVDLAGLTLGASGFSQA